MSDASEARYLFPGGDRSTVLVPVLVLAFLFLLVYLVEVAGLALLLPKRGTNGKEKTWQNKEREDQGNKPGNIRAKFWNRPTQTKM